MFFYYAFQILDSFNPASKVSLAIDRYAYLFFCRQLILLNVLRCFINFLDEFINVFSTILFFFQILSPRVDELHIIFLFTFQVTNIFLCLISLLCYSSVYRLYLGLNQVKQDTHRRCYECLWYNFRNVELNFYRFPLVTSVADHSN